MNTSSQIWLKIYLKIMTFTFKHPKFYRIPRDKSDQAISENTHDGESERASGPGHKLQAASHKHQASSGKLSNQPQASRAKRQASQPE